MVKSLKIRSFDGDDDDDVRHEILYVFTTAAIM